MNVLGWITFFVGGTVLGAILNGWAFQTLWQWFVVTKFGLPMLTNAQAIGLSMLVSFLTTDTRDLKTNETDMAAKISTMTGMLVARPVFTVAIAWVVYVYQFV